MPEDRHARRDAQAKPGNARDAQQRARRLAEAEAAAAAGDCLTACAMYAEVVQGGRGRCNFGWIFDAELDDQGYPLHQGGVAPEAGLCFVGLAWLKTRGSGFIP